MGTIQIVQSSEKPKPFRQVKTYWEKEKKRSVGPEVSFPFQEREKIQTLTYQFLSCLTCHHVKNRDRGSVKSPSRASLYTHPFSWVPSGPKSEFQLQTAALLSIWTCMSRWFFNSVKDDAAFDSWHCLKICTDGPLHWGRLPGQR